MFLCDHLTTKSSKNLTTAAQAHYRKHQKKQFKKSFCILFSDNPVVNGLGSIFGAVNNSVCSFTCDLFRLQIEGKEKPSVCPHCQLKEVRRGGCELFRLLSGCLPNARDHVCCERVHDSLAPGSGYLSGLLSHPLTQSNSGPVSHAFTVNVSNKSNKT